MHSRAAGRGRGGGVRPQRPARPRQYPGRKPISRQTEDGYHHPGPDSPTHRGRYAHPHRSRSGAAGMATRTPTGPRAQSTRNLTQPQREPKPGLTAYW
ncbi:hypothetical protein GCM10009601_05320 [Streptomyces thermospinosisporus]|uniref:Uncharacterized protein n=1 Tax=Streptomyces thermospinosisporus TaxID=161482 RepID=A0ABP4J7U9_9ACTN